MKIKTSKQLNRINFKSIQCWISSNIIQITLFLSVSIYILLHSYYLGAYISPDSTNYLREALTLLNGNGFNYNAEFGITSYFAIWPIGYPLLIAVTAFITHADIYLASKILSIIIIALINIILYRRFKNTAWIYALLTINIGFLAVFSYTWSEQPFILVMIWFSFAIYDIVTKEKPTMLNYISLMTASLLLFFSRYIGGFSIGCIILCVLYFVYLGFKNKNSKLHIRKIFCLSAIIFINLLIFLSYLYANLMYSGYLTGMPRIPAPESLATLIFNLGLSGCIEMQNIFGVILSPALILSIPLWIGAVGYYLYKIYNSLKKRKINNHTILSLVFVFIGTIYFVTIVYMRFTSQFDMFSYRLLLPATIMWFIGFITILLTEQSVKSLINITRKPIVRYAIAGILCVVIIAQPVYLHYYAAMDSNPSNDEINYITLEKTTLDKYSVIPSHSVILWADNDINYLRLDLLSASPKSSPYSVPETIDEFFERMNPYDSVYINIDNMRSSIDSDNRGYDESVSDYFSQFINSNDTFIKIK